MYFLKKEKKKIEEVKEDYLYKYLKILKKNIKIYLNLKVLLVRKMKVKMKIKMIVKYKKRMIHITFLKNFKLFIL